MPQLGIGFDIDHTLLIDNKLERIAFLRLLDAGAGEPAGSERLIGEERAIDDLLERQRRGASTIEEAVKAFVSAHAFQGNDSLDEWIARYKTIALGLVEEIVIPMPGVREMFAGLRELQIPVAILTNGWNPLQQLKAWRAGFEGKLVVSSEIGVQKPDARAFTALAEALGTAERWYVGDNPATDVAGAISSGFKAVWFDAEDEAYPSSLPRPDMRIHSLFEVCQLAENAREQAKLA